MPDCAYLHVERRKTGVTLELLHLEYLEKHPNGYRYTQFCERYREWLDKRHLTILCRGHADSARAPTSSRATSARWRSSAGSRPRSFRTS